MVIYMISITEIVNVLRKGSIAYLSGILCLFCSTSNAEPKMKLEELVQKLEDANPWTVERVESVLGARLALVRSNDVFTVHTSGQFLFEEGLIVEEVHLRLTVATNGMIRLIVSLSDEASCFTLDRIKRTYPDTKMSPYGFPRGHSLNEKTYFWTKRPWGHIAFGFKERRRDCLSSIVYIPTGEE